MSDIALKAYTGGYVYDLDQLRCGFFLQEHGGLGIAEVFRHAQKGPFQVGDTDLGYTQNARFITLGWVLKGRDNFDLWELREEMYSIFRPRTDDPTQLIFRFPNLVTRAIDVNMIGDINIVSQDRLDGKTWKAAVQLKASDPRFYNPTERVVESFIITNSNGWEIEETGQTTLDGWMIGATMNYNGWNIGTGTTIYKSITIVYADQQRNADIEYPIIRIFGPIASPTIRNLITSESIPLTANGGLILAAGEWVEIDLRYESGKTIKDQTGADVSQYLDDANDLATWHLSYNSELVNPSSPFIPSTGRSDGQNLIVITALDATSATRVTFNYYDRFIGV